MLLYPISWKGTLFLDNPNHSLKYSFMFAIKPFLPMEKHFMILFLLPDEAS